MGLAPNSSFLLQDSESQTRRLSSLFLLSILFEEDGLLSFKLEEEAGYIMISVGGVPIVSEPCDEGEE